MLDFEKFFKFVGQGVIGSRFKSQLQMLPDTRVVCSTASMKEEEDALNDSSDEEADDLPGPSCSAKPLFGYPADEDVAPWATKSYYPLSLHG